MSQAWVQVLESVEAAARAKGLLRDHRSLLPHLDDHLRICHIAKEKGASFRSLPGVVSWANRESHNQHTCFHQFMWAKLECMIKTCSAGTESMLLDLGFAALHPVLHASRRHQRLRHIQLKYTLPNTNRVTHKHSTTYVLVPRAHNLLCVCYHLCCCFYAEATAA